MFVQSPNQFCELEHHYFPYSCVSRMQVCTQLDLSLRRLSSSFRECRWFEYRVLGWFHLPPRLTWVHQGGGHPPMSLSACKTTKTLKTNTAGHPPPQFMFKIYSVSWVCGLVCYIFWLKDIKDGFILDLRTTAIREMIMLMSFLERKGQSLCDWPWRILLLSLVISYSLILVHYWGWNSKTKLMIKFSITTELGDMGHLEYQSSSAL